MRTLVCAIALWLLLASFSCSLHAQPSKEVLERAGNAQVEEVMRTFAPRGVQSDGSQPTPPEQAVRTFELADDMSIDLMASEPDISQPLFLSWDSRGRMWVVQYRQYQYPAGLKVVRYDHHLRAVFDKVPKPPPHHVEGKDRITVFEDTDGDGEFDTHKDVMTGLNITSSLAVGHGGIWVLNPPYLLFYPDRDRDDIPDGDPEVRLSGFGMQDTHSVANSLLWGPDGWLYGANGSTTGGTVSSEVTPGVTFQGQCIWRYHPDTREFEIYAEGGGNTFSLEIDSKGRVFSGHNGGNTRGWYFPQGSYSRKNWGKHGPLTNPYAFGFFESMRLEGDTRRFAQAFLIYEGGLFPHAEFDGSIVAPNSMQNLVWHSLRIKDGSTYRTVDQDNLAQSSDRWFRPVYGGVGPDGGIYVADWYDTRLSHVSPTDDWHKESGRVYRIRPTDTQPSYPLGDLATKTDAELIALFENGNKWVRRRAVLELTWRKSLASNSLGQLEELVDEEASLEALWVIANRNRLTKELAAKWLRHADAHIRRWTVRSLGDRHVGHTDLVTAARAEKDIQVRSQLAASAKRIDAKTGLAVATELLRNEEDLSDRHMPLMIWWAVEAHADDWDSIVDWVSDPAVQGLPFFRKEIASRLMRRYAADGSAAAISKCNELIRLADPSCKEQLVEGLNQAFQGRSLPKLPKELTAALNEYRRAAGDEGLVLAIGQGDAEAAKRGVGLLRNNSTGVALRIDLANAYGAFVYPEAVPVLLSLATGSDIEPALQRVAIQSLASYENEDIARRIASAFENRISAQHGLRDAGCRTLASRLAWAKVLLAQVNGWRLRKSDVPPDVIQRLRTYSDPNIVEAVERAFGPVPPVNSPAKVAFIRKLTSHLSENGGEYEEGSKLYVQHCATCHQLAGIGESIGPALDNYDRGNLKFWLPAIVAPSLEIREGYQTYLALTVDGRVVTGMVSAQDLSSVTIRTADAKQVKLERDELEEFRAVKNSLMPEGILEKLTPKQVSDLFAFLRAGTE